MSYAKLLREKRAALQAELEELAKVEAADFTPERQERGSALVSEIDDFDARITEAEQVEERARIANEAAVAAGEVGKEERVGGAHIVSEPRTYTEQTSRQGTSFFADAFSMRDGDAGARDRIERHGREVVAEREISKRATTTSSFAGLIVPQYLVDRAALVARAGRPVANTLDSLPLPDQGTTFQVPLGTTGATTAIQATENSSVSNTDEAWSNLTVNVCTAAGQQDVSRQSLERGTPGLDALIYVDLAGAYAADLDAKVINGSGSSGQPTGILNTSSINAATAFGAAVSASNYWSKTAGQVQAILGSRFMPADHIAIAPRRFGWLLSQVDSSNRPLLVPSAAGNVPQNAQGVYEGIPGGGFTFMGLPVTVDANIPTTVGTNSEDVELLYRAADLLLWEDGDGMPRQLRFEQTLGNQLTVKLVVYGYYAFTAGRYPKAVGKVGGADSSAGDGLIAPTF